VKKNNMVTPPNIWCEESLLTSHLMVTGFGDTETLILWNPTMHHMLSTELKVEPMINITVFYPEDGGSIFLLNAYKNLCMSNYTE
jgi:hypothetical protein